MTKIRLLIVTLFAFLLFIPLVCCSHDSSNGGGVGGLSQPSYSSSHLVDFVWTIGSGETFTFYDDGTYYYENNGTGSWGTYKKDANGNFTLTGDDGSGFYFEISDDSATVYETEKGKKKDGSEGTSFNEINPSCCTVAEAAKYISVLTGDTTYTFVVVDNTETSCSALKTALNGLSSTESVGPYVSLDLTRATELNLSVSAFKGTSQSNPCYVLREIILPEECDSIGNYAFEYQAGLQNVVLPTTLVTIGDYAFNECKSLMSSITLPETLTTIGDYAFAWCESLNSIDLSNTQVTEIGAGAFQDCKSLTSVGENMPETLTTLSHSAFSSCKSLTNIDLSKTQVTKIENYVFANCSSLKSIDLSNIDVTDIGTDAFYCCKSLTSITLPKTLITIGDYAFAWCESLNSIDLNDTQIIEMEYGAFYQCSSLTEIKIEKTEGMAWGHPSNTKTEELNPSQDNLEIVSDFEDAPVYYLTGNNSAKGGANTTLSQGYTYYWYKVGYTEG